MKYLLYLAAVLAVVLGNQPATAGARAIRENKYEFRQVAVLAKGMERALAERRAQVAIIGRVGLNPEILPPGVRFSHAGFAVYSRIQTRDDRLLPGYAVYNLYQGEERSGRSHLAQDYPVDYLAVAQRLEVGIIIPNRKLQQALLRTIFSPAYQGLHNPNYSVLSNPFDATTQNCTEFVLDVIFAAIYDTRDIRQLKANISAYFTPQPIRVDEMTLALAAMTMPDMSTDDHQGPITTATFSSIGRFLLHNQLADAVLIYTVDPQTLYGTIRELDLQAD